MSDLSKDQFSFFKKNFCPISEINNIPRRLAIFWDIAGELKTAKNLPINEDDSVMIILSWAAVDWDHSDPGTVAIGSLSKLGFEPQQKLDKSSYGNTWYMKRFI